MTERVSRRGVVFTTLVMAAVVALASTAFACGVWKGRLVVIGDHPTDPGRSEATGAGPGNGMAHCADANTPVLSGANITAVSASNPDGGTFTLGTYKAAGCTGGTPNVNYLTDGSYTVNYLSWDMRETAMSDDCMNGTEGGSTTGVGIPLPTNDTNTADPETVRIGISGNDGEIDFGTVTVGPVLGEDQEPGSGTTAVGKSIVCIAGVTGTATGTSNNQVAVEFV